MQINEILLPVDGSSHSGHAVEYAIHLAKLYEARITIVHCYEVLDTALEVSGLFAKEVRISAEKHAATILEKAAQMVKMAGVVYTTRTIWGSPGKVLYDLAKSKEFDLIIMGSHGHSEIAGMFLGSVTHKVLNTIHCPVMVVP
jgi:nucleotide-binding universal stress UspA family protein